MLQLRMRNYRRLRDPGRLDFPRGLTIVTGANGAGKTTLIEAIGYALFGQRGAESLRTDGVEDEPLEVDLTLQVDTHTVRIRRVNTMAEVTVDGVVRVPLERGSARAAQAEIARLLGGLSRTQFETTYFAPQGQGAALLLAAPRQRGEMLEVALGADVIKQAAQRQERRADEALGTLVGRAEQVADLLGLDAASRKPLANIRKARTLQKRREHGNRLIERLRAVASECVGAAEVAGNRERQAAAACDAARRAAAAAADACTRARHAWAALEQLRPAYEEACRAREGARKRHEEAQWSLEVVAADYQEALAGAAAARRHRRCGDLLEWIDRRRAALAECERRWPALRVAVEHASVFSGDAPLDLAALTARIEDLQRRRGRVQVEREETERTLALLADPGAPCRTCGTSLDPATHEARRRELAAWLEQCATRIAADLGREEACLRALARARDALAAWRGVESGTLSGPLPLGDELQAERKALFRSQDRLTRARQRLEERRAHLAPDAARYGDREHRLARLAEQQQRVRELEQVLQVCEATCAAVGYDQEEADRHRRQLEELAEARHAAEQALGDAEQTHARARVDAATAHARASDAAEHCAGVERALEAALREQQLCELYERFRHTYQQQNLAQIARRANALLECAVQDGAIHGLQFTVRNEIEYLDAEGRQQPVARLSGGEAAVAGLCLRLAVAEQAQALAAGGRLRILVLDEVLAPLDDERLEAVGRVFEALQSRGVFDHILLVTHLEAVKANWPGAGLRVYKTDGVASEAVLLGQG